MSDEVPDAPVPVPEVVAEPVLEVQAPEVLVAAPATIEAAPVASNPEPDVEIAADTAASTQQDANVIDIPTSDASNFAPDPVDPPAHNSTPIATEQSAPSHETSVVSQTAENPLALTAEERSAGIATRLRHREENLLQIVEFARTKPLITNDDVEKLLHCSDATASRYLTLLVTRGLLHKHGKGRGVTYTV